MSYIILCLIFDSYIRQKACVAWGLFRSQYFLFKNGVKQGGVLSPIFFIIYIDKLLVMLRTTGIGCHLGGAYSSALSYADGTATTVVVRSAMWVPAASIGVVRLAVPILATSASTAAMPAWAPTFVRAGPLYVASRIDTLTCLPKR